MDQPELDKLKSELEVLKLTRETSRWGWDFKLQTKDVFSFLVAVVGLWLAWYSGIFDAKNLLIEAKNERIKNEALIAGERNRKIEEQSTSLTAELEQLQSEVERYRLTESNLQHLQKSGNVAVRYEFNFNRFSFHIEREIGFPAPSAADRSEYLKLSRQIGNVGEILSQIYQLKLPAPVEIINIRNTSVTPEDLEKLGAMHVEWILLENTNSTDESLRSLEKLDGLTALTLTDQVLGKVDSISCLPNLERLFLTNAGIESGNFNQPLKCSQKLEWLIIDDQNFSDSDVEWLFQFTKLRSLYLKHTKVSTAGLRRIAERLDANIEFSPTYQGSETEYPRYVEEMNTQIKEIKATRGDLKSREIRFAPIRFDWGSIFAP